jgi:hypothetical protein
MAKFHSLNTYYSILKIIKQKKQSKIKMLYLFTFTLKMSVLSSLKHVLRLNNHGKYFVQNLADILRMYFESLKIP